MSKSEAAQKMITEWKNIFKKHSNMPSKGKTGTPYQISDNKEFRDMNVLIGIDINRKEFQTEGEDADKRSCTKTICLMG